MGDDLVTVVGAMLQYGNRWLAVPGAPVSRMIEAKTGQNVAPVCVRNQDGRPLRRTEVGLVTDAGQPDSD